MKRPRGLIFGLSALSLLLVACARLAPISRFNDDLSLPPSLDLADFSDNEPAGKGSVPASAYQRALPTGALGVIARTAPPSVLTETDTRLEKSRVDPSGPVRYRDRPETGNLEISKTDNDLSMTATLRPSALLNVKASYVEQPLGGIESLLDLENQEAGLNLRAEASLANSKLNVYGEWDYRAFDPRTGYDFGQDQKRMFEVGFDGRERQLSYGGKHGFAGNDYESEFDTRDKREAAFKPGKKGSMFWARWSFGALGIKGSVLEHWDNPERDREKPRITDRWTGVTLEYNFSSWPYVGYSLGYFRGTRSNSQEPLGYSRHEEPMERLESTLDYAGGSWSASLYASYARVTQAQRSSSLPTSTLMHYLSASFYPIESFSITPALGYYDQNYSQFDARTVNRSASLAMFYQPVGQNIRYTAFGSYDSESNRIWDIERRSYYLDGGLIWSFGGSSIAHSSLSLGFAYNRYLDAVYSESNSEDLSVWLMFRVGSWAFARVTPQFLFER